MVSSNDVTITEHEGGEGGLRVEWEQGTVHIPRNFYVPPHVVAALRAHFAAERMPEDVQELVAEARSYSDAHRRTFAPTTADLLSRLAAALEAAYSQKAESEWEYGVQDYRSRGDGVLVVGPTWDASLREFYGERPLMRRHPAGEWEPVEKGAE